LEYKEKRKKVLAVLDMYISNKRIVNLIDKIQKDSAYEEHRLDEIYSTLYHTAHRKKHQQQESYGAQRESTIATTKEKKDKIQERDKQDADILLDSLLDHRCD
jgi:putative cell wall-binding protein